MSLTTSFSTGSARTASPRALITPFVQPASCNDIFSTTSIISSFYWNNYSTVTLPVLVSDTADPRFASCQPPSWASRMPESRFSFSPAVCPSDWTAYKLGTTESAVSTAYCCSRGYGLLWPAEDMSIQGVSSPACFKDPSATVPPTSVAFPNGMQIHNAWHISWASSDKAYLSPTPPALDCSQRIATWVPGQSVAQTSCPNPYNSSSSHYLSAPVLYFAAIGVPLISIILIATCCILCFRHRRKERRVHESRVAQT